MNSYTVSITPEKITKTLVKDGKTFTEELKKQEDGSWADSGYNFESDEANISEDLYYMLDSGSANEMELTKYLS